MGRPAHSPTPQQREAVRRYAAHGVAQSRIAAAIRISEPTLREHYREELDEGGGRFEADFEMSLAQRALDLDPKNNVLAIFFAKVRLRYRELVAEDPDTKKPAEMTDDELRDAIAARERQRRAGQGAVEKGKRSDVAA